MAIIKMVTKEHATRVDNVGIELVTNFPGAEVGRVQHYCDKCPKSQTYDVSGKVQEGCCTGLIYKDGVKVSIPHCGKEYCTGCRVITEPLYMETTYIGRVLEIREENGYHDSDFYATVWDDEKGCTENILYATTRGWTYPNGAKVDATPEVKEKFRAWSAKRQEERRLAYEAEQAMIPSHGKKVRVVKGKKSGIEGEVFWVGPCKFNRHKTNVGIRMLNGDKVFIDSANVEVQQGV